MANTATSLYTASPATDYIILDFNPATQLNTLSWTIELWMYNPTGYTMSSYNGTHGFYIAPADSSHIYLNNGGRAASLGPIGVSGTGGWQHVAMVRNNEYAYAYLNGELKFFDSTARTTQLGVVVQYILVKMVQMPQVVVDTLMKFGFLQRHVMVILMLIKITQQKIIHKLQVEVKMPYYHAM